MRKLGMSLILCASILLSSVQVGASASSLPQQEVKETLVQKEAADSKDAEAAGSENAQILTGTKETVQTGSTGNSIDTISGNDSLQGSDAENDSLAAGSTPQQGIEAEDTETAEESLEQEDETEAEDAIIAVSQNARAFSLARTAAQARTGAKTIYTEYTSGSGAGNGTENSPYNDFGSAVAAASAGDTIIIKSNGVIANDPDGQSSPLVIDKELTIQGDGSNPTLSVWAGGILLGADVTMKNFKITHSNLENVGIFANGYTLQLENVVSTGVRLVDVYTGNRVDRTVTSGQTGTVRVSGVNTVLGNIYAGNYSPSTGSVTPWTGGSDISVEGKASISSFN